MGATHPHDAPPHSTKRLNILFLYDRRRTEETAVHEHLASFEQHSRHNIFYNHDAQRQDAPVPLEPFDAVVLHSSLAEGTELRLAPALAHAVRAYDGLKLLFLRDEYEKSPQLATQIDELGINVFFSCVPEGQATRFYPQLDWQRVEIVSVAARYQPRGLDGGLFEGLPALESLVQSFDAILERRVPRPRRRKLTAVLLLAADPQERAGGLERAHQHTALVAADAAGTGELTVLARALSDHVDLLCPGRLTDRLDPPDRLETEMALPEDDGVAAALTRVAWSDDVKHVCQGRLTTQLNEPIGTQDYQAQRGLYFCPYHGNRVALFDGRRWQIHAFKLVPLTLDEVEAGVNYDVFLHADDGLRLELAAWANDRRRVLELDLFDGVLTRAGSPTRRYLGTIRGSGQQLIEDSRARRFVWNVANQVPKNLFTGDTSAHEYASNRPRLWNGDPTVRFEFVLGRPQELAVQCSAFLKTHTPGEPALIYPTLDGSDQVYPELGRYLGNYNTQFVGASTAGSMLIESGLHHVGAAESSGPAGATFANVWLHGSLLC